MKKYTLWGCFVVLTIIQNTLVLAQYSSQSNKAIQFYERGNDLFQKQKYDEAFEQYTEALKKDNQFAEAHYKIAQLYQWYNQTEKMYEHFAKAIELQPDNKDFIGAYYHLCEKKLKEGQYAESKKLGQKYLSLNPKNALKIKQVNLWIQSCDYAEENIKKSLNVQIRPLEKPLNKLYLQYFPVFTADLKTLFFTGAKKPAANQDYQEDIYVSYWKDTAWTNPRGISQKINTPTENEGTCTISADGKMLIFTLCRQDKQTGKTNCDLYSSTWNGTEWTEPQNLGENINTQAWESQPSLSADGNTLYFASTREGGFGGRDIWVSTRNEQGIWQKPQNLGEKINTVFDETSPFIHFNGKTLYFASNGRVGFGGYDLYQSDFLNKQWTEPQNLGYPINNSQDQIGFFVTPDARKSYFAIATSYKEQVISSLLYEMTLPQEIQPVVKSSFVKGIVYDSLTKKPIEATLELFDLATNTLQSTIKSNLNNGEYLITLNSGLEYSLEIRKEGYAFKSLKFNYIETKEPKPLEINIPLMPISKGLTFRLDNIYFEFGKYTLQDKSKVELDQLVLFMKQNPTIKGEISGHTDNIGDKKRNEILSLNRAKAVYDYLIKAGIEPNRLTYKGYGDTRPSAPNDTEENRAKNRRIEFEIQ
ncbi:MAG: OmpA family protein [Microscillaceae bacterium]|nr:OmpA family protein [Microscillaceae bacterium]MDW8460687.1 OmpA family protein [Cytophagales bacterium]